MQYMLGDRQQIISRRHVSSGLDTIGKYLIHGFIFSFMMIAAEIVLAAILVMLIIFASVLGFFIWFGLVFLAWGWVNGMLCSWLWDFDVKQHWTNLVGHGLVLFLVLLIVGIPVTAILPFVTTGISPAIYIPVRLASLSVFDGIIGKAIGEMFRASGTQPVTSKRRPTLRRTCPFCGALFPYRDRDLSPEGTAPCRQCGAIIHDPRYVRAGASKPHSTPQY
ncbi:MAG: hypothetical protein ACFFCP_03550 [Promethearchaeota archaeon]